MYTYSKMRSCARRWLPIDAYRSVTIFIGSTRATSQANPRFVDFVGRRSFQVPGPRPACLTSLQL